MHSVSREAVGGIYGEVEKCCCMIVLCCFAVLRIDRAMSVVVYTAAGSIIDRVVLRAGSISPSRVFEHVRGVGLIEP